MKILKSQKIIFSFKNNKFITREYILNNKSFNNTFQKRELFCIRKKYISSEIKTDSFQIDDKINILSKHKFEIPDRFRLMPSGLKSFYLQTDFPYYYRFQQNIFQMINTRNSDFNITLVKGNYFFMKNILLNLTHYSLNVANRDESKIHNVIICVNKFFKKRKI